MVGHYGARLKKNILRIGVVFGAHRVKISEKIGMFDKTKLYLTFLDVFELHISGHNIIK